MDKTLFALSFPCRAECPGCFGYVIFADPSLRSNLMPIFASRELAEIAAVDLEKGDGRAPEVVEIKIARV